MASKMMSSFILNTGNLLCFVFYFFVNLVKRVITFLIFQETNIFLYLFIVAFVYF